MFIPWYVDPEYREPVPTNFEPTPDEEDLIKKYGLDNEQLMFRRRKVAQNGIDLWNQEYPAEPEQAFLTTAGLCSTQSSCSDAWRMRAIQKTVWH